MLRKDRLSRRTTALFAIIDPCFRSGLTQELAHRVCQVPMNVSLRPDLRRIIDCLPLNLTRDEDVGRPCSDVH